MIKKRRDFGGQKFFELEKVDYPTNDEVVYEKYTMLPEYGEGYMKCYDTQDISVTISKYRLCKDLVFKQLFTDNVVQISFLLEGEKNIYLENEKEISFEERESYMATIKYFNGVVRILSDKLFKEVKIKISKSFLFNSGLINDECYLKELTDKNLIIPITDEVFSILDKLQRRDITGAASKIYLNAKVLELMAVQMENYKNVKSDVLKTGTTKILKKLSLVKQIIKSNISDKKSVVELANETGINSGILNREFLRVYGCSVYEFSISEKMKQAKYLLENSKNMVYLISEEVGYKNATHFTAAFKRRYGLTPKQYREML